MQDHEYKQDHRQNLINYFTSWILYIHINNIVRLGGVVVRCWTCDQQVASSTPGRWAITCSLGQVVHTDVPLSLSSINLVPAEAGRVTVGLASHWPCIIDNRPSGIHNYQLTTLERGMSTLPMFQPERTTSSFLPNIHNIVTGWSGWFCITVQITPKVICL